MEDYTIDPVIDAGQLNARTVQIELEPFTLVGATTRSGLLTAPLRARFGINSRLSYYDAKTLTDIVERSAGILDIPITADAAFEIAKRSRGTPRIANALLRRVRDFAEIKGDGTINLDITKYGLDALNVDEHGLDEMDNKILLTIIEKFRGGPVGLTTVATAVGEQADTIEEVYEPFLIQEGFIVRTPRGRQATELAMRHFGKVGGQSNNGQLFWMSAPRHVLDDRSALVKRLAQSHGFMACGISQAGKLEAESRRLETWLNRGYHGKMGYMENHFEKRTDPTLLVSGAKSGIPAVQLPQSRHARRPQRPQSVPIRLWAGLPPRTAP